MKLKGRKSRLLSKALCVSLPTSKLEKESKKAARVVPGRIYDRRVHVILRQDFSPIPISSSQLVRLSSEDHSVPADTDTVYALVKISITQVDFQDNSVPTDPDAEYALTKTIHGHPDSDSDSDPEFSLIQETTGQADFEENSVSVDPDAKY